MLTLSLVAADRFMAVVFPFCNICTIISILLVRRPTTGVECRFEAMLPRQIHISVSRLCLPKCWSVIPWTENYMYFGKLNHTQSRWIKQPRPNLTWKTLIKIKVSFLCCLLLAVVYYVPLRLKRSPLMRRCQGLNVSENIWLDSGFTIPTWTFVYGASNDKAASRSCCIVRRSVWDLSRFKHNNSASSSLMQ